jgi:hypothetical protein
MAEHHDHRHPEFGYVPPEYGFWSNFERAGRAHDRAARTRGVHDQLIATKALAGDLPGDVDRQMHAEAVAAEAYARAVYDVEAAKVRSA